MSCWKIFLFLLAKHVLWYSCRFMSIKLFFAKNYKICSTKLIFSLLCQAVFSQKTKNRFIYEEPYLTTLLIESIDTYQHYSSPFELYFHYLLLKHSLDRTSLNTVNACWVDIATTRPIITVLPFETQLIIPVLPSDVIAAPSGESNQTYITVHSAA